MKKSQFHTFMNQKIKVLFTDDEDINHQVFQLYFEDDYDILMATDGNQALQILSENDDIKVVISDLVMPGMNGIEFISEAKIKYPEIHFFILTGYEISDDLRTILNNKIATGYFRKPLNANEVKIAINNILN